MMCAEKGNSGGDRRLSKLLKLIVLSNAFYFIGDIQCISTEKFRKEEIVILLAKELIKRYK